MTPAELAADTAGANLFFTALSLGVARAAIELLRAGAPTPCCGCGGRAGPGAGIGPGGGRSLGRSGDAGGAGGAM